MLCNILGNSYLCRITDLSRNRHKKIIVSNNLGSVYFDDHYNVVGIFKGIDELISDYDNITELIHSGVYIYASDEFFADLFMFFLAQFQETYNVEEDRCSILCNKLVERSFVENSENYIVLNSNKLKEFKNKVPSIYDNMDRYKIPLEYMYFLHSYYKVDESDLRKKVQDLLPSIAWKFLASISSMGFELIIANPVVLDEYFKREINADVVSIILSDSFLKDIFSFRLKSKEEAIDFLTSNSSKIAHLVDCIQRNSIAFDNACEGDRLNKELNRVIYCLNSDGKKFFDCKSINFFGEYFFTEEGDKFNILLIKYLANQKRMGKI